MTSDGGKAEASPRSFPRGWQCSEFPCFRETLTASSLLWQHQPRVPHSRPPRCCGRCSLLSLPACWIDSWQPFLACICLFPATTCSKSLNVCSAQSRLEKSFWRINLYELFILIIDGRLGSAGTQLPEQAGARGHGELLGWACKSVFQGITLFPCRYATCLFIAHLYI